MQKLTTAQSLVLCFYSTTAPALNALNRSATAKVTADSGASSGAARVYNTVLRAKGTAVGRAISLQQRTGVDIRRFGLPCPAGGSYMRVRDIFEVQNLFDDAMAELDTIREDILSTYPDIIDAVRNRLGNLRNGVNLPSATEVASKFTMSLTITNQPVAVDGPVLSGLSEEVANRVRAESQKQVADMLKASHAGPVNDLKATLSEFIDRMRNAERLHLTQFDKLKEEAKRLQGLNVLGLPEIDALADVAIKVASIPDYALTQGERVDIAVRAEGVRQQADDTLDALGL